MLTKIFSRKSKIITSFVITAALSTVILAQTALAHNVPFVVKAVNVDGYQFNMPDTNHNSQIEIFFDKGLYDFQSDQIKIKDSNNNDVAFTKSSGSYGAGWLDATAAPGGTDIILTTASNLSWDTDYKVIISSTVRMGNSYHLTVGNYWGHKDIEFYVRTPRSDGTYNPNAVPILSFIPSTTGAGVSANVEVISSIPIDNSSFTLSDVKLQKYAGQQWIDVQEDTTIDAQGDTNVMECFSSRFNRSYTCIFLPETAGGYSGALTYNLLSYNTDYKLVIPDSMKAVNGQDFADDDFIFTTGEDTSAATGNTAITASGSTGTSVNLSWQDVAADSTGTAPDHYHVYYSTNPYFGFNEHKSNDVISHSGSTNTVTITGLSSNTTYYFRVVSANSADEEGGFSPYVAQATTN